MTNAYAVAAVVGVVAATADVACGHGNHTVNNFLATMIAADFLSLVGLGSFAAAGSLLLGLLCYDAFWVFGSGYVFGDGTADNVMMAVATSDAFRGPFRLLFPGSKTRSIRNRWARCRFRCWASATWPCRACSRASR